MTITLIEGLILLSVAGVGGVIWWGVLRLVSTNDQTLTELTAINAHLSLINGRLGKSEVWMEMHQEQDKMLFNKLDENIRRLWEKVEPSRS